MTKKRFAFGGSRVGAPSGLPRAVIWDLDGTLVDSATDIASALNALLLECGLEAHSVERVRTMIGGGIERLVERGWAARGESPCPREIDRLSTRFQELYAERATDETRLFDNVEDVLHDWALGVSQAVCTNKPRAISESILQSLEIGQLFDAVIGGDSTKERSLILSGDIRPSEVAGRELGRRHGRRFRGGCGGGARRRRARGACSPRYSDTPVDALGAEAVIDSVSDLFGALAALPRTA